MDRKKHQAASKLPQPSKLKPARLGICSRIYRTWRFIMAGAAAPPPAGGGGRRPPRAPAPAAGPAMVACPHCGKNNPSDAPFCAYCREAIGSVACPHCGKHNPADAPFCAYCRESMTTTPAAPTAPTTPATPATTAAPAAKEPGFWEGLEAGLKRSKKKS